MLEFGSNLIRPLSWMYVLYVETNILIFSDKNNKD